MAAVAVRPLARVVLLLMAVLASCSLRLLGAVCDQPVVSFSAGQLTISSNGCSLQQVLTAVGRKTGVDTTLPPSTHAVPVFVHLGPGDPRRIVSALLDGVPFNWSLATTDNESPAIIAIVLSDQVAFSAPAQTMSANKKELISASDARSASLSGPLPELPKPRTEIDQATLSKLPPLPSGVPVGMWQLFPDVFSNLMTNGVTQSSSASFPNQPSSSALNQQSVSAPSSGLRGCEGCPVPPGIPPNIVNLFPWNTMQLIHTPPTPSTLQLPPPPTFPKAP